MTDHPPVPPQGAFDVHKIPPPRVVLSSNGDGDEQAWTLAVQPGATSADVVAVAYRVPSSAVLAEGCELRFTADGRGPFGH